MTDTDTREPGVVTITAPPQPPPLTRPRPLAPPVQPAPPAPGPRESKGRRAVWTEERGAQRRATREDGASRRPGDERGRRALPFFLLLCVLLGGALVCALVISTTLAEGSFQITKLQQSNDALARQRQMLQEQVAAAQSAQVIESRALQLGMRTAGELRFLNLKTGKVQTDAGSGAVAAINVPGYTP